jgi:hypothetical protein
MPLNVEDAEPLPSERMPALDEGVVRMLWEAGASWTYISKRHPVTRRRLRELSEDWDGEKRAASLVARGHTNSAPVGTVPEARTADTSTVETWLAAIGKIVKPRWDEASFPLLEVAEALHNITRGMPVALACEAAGLTDRVVQKYRNQEPRLEGYFRRARALSAKPLVEKIMGNPDWRAAAWLLERGIAKAEFKAEAVGKEDKLTIEIMVNREDKDALRGVIDVTESANGAMVIGLPAEREAEDLPRGQG